MGAERPYLLNYAIGCIVAMAIDMMFSSLIILVYPELVTSSIGSRAAVRNVFVCDTVLLFILALALICYSKIGYWLTLLLLGATAVLTTLSLVYNGLITYALFFQCALSIASFILLVTPPVWKFFRDEGVLVGKAPNVVRVE